MIEGRKPRSFSDIVGSSPNMVIKARRRFSIGEKIRQFFLGYIVEDFEPPEPIPNKKTLILDLDETLIHTCQFRPHESVESFHYGIDNLNVFLRPGLKEFLEFAKNNFDVFIFTSAEQEYADYIINEIAPWITFDHRFYRDSCFDDGLHFKKDIAMFKRDLRSVIIVDDNFYTDESNPENTILIQRWAGAPYDTELTKWLIPILKECLTSNDVRVPIKKEKIKHIKRRQSCFVISPPLF